MLSLCVLDSTDDGTTYLVLFGSEKYDSIYNRITYHISMEGGIT